MKKVLPDLWKRKNHSKHEIRQRITIWAVSIASIFIIGIIGAGYVFDQKQQSEETIIDSDELDEYIEELKANTKLKRKNAGKC